MDALVPTQRAALPPPAAAAAPGSGRRRRRGAAAASTAAVAETAVEKAGPSEPSRPSELVASLWDPSPVPAADPTEGLVAQQRSLFRERLELDRKLMWHDRQRAFSARLAQVTEQSQAPPAPVDELAPAVVEEIFGAVIEDPVKELAEHRDTRRSETLAVHLEQLLACDPPAGLREVLAGTQLQLVSVELPDPEEGAAGLHSVLFRARRGQDGVLVQRRLNTLAPRMARALARRMCLSVAPALRFVPAAEPLQVQRPSRSALWRVSRRERRVTVHGAMHAWQANMHF